jgi:putative inorganic carbon (hco3(-)) transporter
MTTEPKITTAPEIGFDAPTMFITPKRIGVTLFILLAVGTGLIALLVPPIIIAGAIVAALGAMLILLYPYFGLLVYYMVLVVNPGVIWPQLAALHADTLLGGFLLISLLIHKKIRHERIIFFQEKTSWLLLAFAMALTLSVPASVWPSNSFRMTTDFLRTILYYMLMVNIADNEKRLKGFVWMFIVVNGYDAISSALAYFGGSLMFAQGIERAESLSGADPNTLAVNLVLALPFMVFAFVWTKNRFLRLVLVGLSSASIFTVAITGSRAGVIGLVLSLFFIWLLSPKRIVTATVFVLVMALGWLALPAQYKTRYSSVFNSEVDESTQGRFDAWKAGVNMFVARPLTGVGVGNFAVAYASGDYSSRGNWLKAHSLYVQLIAELGMVGVLTFVPLIAFMMHRNFRLRRRLQELKMTDTFVKWLSYSITCSVGTLFFTSIFGHSLFRLHWYWCCGLTVILWTLVDRQTKDLQLKGSGKNVVRLSGTVSKRG